MHASEIRNLADGLLEVVLAAGRVQMNHLALGVVVETKADRSPVTAADRESEALILAGLARAAPGVAIVAEESGPVGLANVDAPFFLVDPLDGTRGYVKGRHDFTINVALIEQRRPVFGIVYAPAHGEFYATLAEDEAVAAALAPSSTARRLGDCDLRPIRTRVADPAALRALTSQAHLNEATTLFLAGYAIEDRRSIASSIKFCIIAKGEADIYPRIGETHEWDTAAGHAILAAAGGSVTSLDGAPLLYGKPRFLNPNFVAWGRGPLPPRH